MDVTLIHNPSSGDKNHSAERIRSRIEDAGHRLTYRSVADQDWDDDLGRQTDLVVVAGGDGTVGEVMKQLAGGATPLAILPAGTANNIAASRSGNPPPLSLPVRRAGCVRLVPPPSVGLRLDDAPWGPGARELTANVGPAVEVLLP